LKDDLISQCITVCHTEPISLFPEITIEDTASSQ
jgi:hypothetical protein